MLLHKLQCVEVAGPEISALRDKMRKVLLSKEAAGVRDEYPKAEKKKKEKPQTGFQQSSSAVHLKERRALRL